MITDQAQKQCIKEVVVKMADSDRKFTAWDITRLARQMGVRAFHRDINDEVRQLFADGEIKDYTRTYTQVAGIHTPVMIYHPNTQTADNYDPESNAPVASAHSVTVAPQTAPAAVDSGDDDDDDDSDDTITVGSKVILQAQGDPRFIRIPAAFMRAIGAKSGDQIVVNSCYGRIEVIYASHGGGTQVTDARNNLRIYSKTLCNLGTTNQYTVEVRDTKPLYIC